MVSACRRYFVRPGGGKCADCVSLELATPSRSPR
ncbi:(2Fe-2S)-binding protein [Pseudomonas sp. Pseusp11]